MSRKPSLPVDPPLGSNFGASASRALAEANLSQAQLARTIGVSAPYINQVLRGHKNISPQWVDLIAAALDLSEQRRVELHRAAALDHGFKLDLSR